MTALGKFQKLLQTLFQFDCADLDFGIYRILNYKRECIETFIEKRLPQIVDNAFADYAAADKVTIEQKIEQVHQQIRESIGEQAFDKQGKLKTEFRETPLGKQYLAQCDKQAKYEVAAELKTRVYNDLYNFFSRYYEDGDFVSKRRYGNKEAYAIPYNGEEVVLHWANKDQYYIKTGEQFKTYRFKVEDCTVAFELRNADTEQNNNKGQKRYFILAGQNPVQHSNGLLQIFFEYRPLTGKEQSTFGKNEQQRPQENLNEKAEETILKLVQKTTLKALRPQTGAERTLLHKHLTQFTRKNTSDFFIHKDLRSFLRHELDFYLKNEVLLLDELLNAENPELATQRVLQGHVIRKVGEAITDFLAQVEDFQRRLFVKKKFVVRTEYCLTLDRMPEALWDEVLKNKTQIAEWQELFALDELLQKVGKKKSDKAFLTVNPKLVVDTRHFSEDFKWRLLSHFDDLDDAFDGVLFQSENFQALNLLLEKYRERVKCIYIDPPFNLGENADFLYKVNYKDSAWMALLQDRLAHARSLLDINQGSIFVRCNHDGNMLVRLILNALLGAENFRNEIIVRRAEESKGDLNKQFESTRSITVNYDTLYWYSIRPDARFGRFLKPANEKQEKAHWHSFWKAEDRPKQRYDILGIDLTKHYGQWMWSPERAMVAVENYKEYQRVTEKTDESLEEYWRRMGERHEFISRQGDGFSSIKYWIPPRSFVMADNNWLDIKGYANIWGFKTENSEPLLKRIIESLTDKKDLVLDFFIGSGTTAATAHKLQRKWIAIEMGEHFETIIMPRMKTVLQGDETGISREVNWKGGGFFKYQTLEQYEDTLNNLALLRENDGQKTHQKFGDDYLLRYMLEFETQGSPCLLNLDMMKSPFEYRLKVQEGDEIVERTVDLIETFNYLIGLHVKKMRAFENDGHTYRAVSGEQNGKSVVIIWRPLNGLEDNKTALCRDKQFIEKDVLSALLGIGVRPDRLLVNGSCHVENAEAIEPEFKRLMFRETV